MMNIYKFEAMIKEFLFLNNILIKKETDWHFSSEEEKLERINYCTEMWGDRIGFRLSIDEGESGYVCPYHLRIPDGIQVKKTDDNLLSQTPESDSYSWCDGGYHNYTSYYAISGDEIVALKSSANWATGSGDRGSEDAPTIGEQLFQLKLNPDFIVCEDFQDTDANGNGEESLNITIYKMKGFDLKGYHSEQIKRVIAEMQTEVETACREGGE